MKFYSCGGSLVADHASGGTELAEVGREHPLKASRVSAARDRDHARSA
jgi:hypothetical protein